MKEIESSNKTIAKNTMMLYIRMGLSMIVGLYTSRVILQVLGITDMGIYASVGGIVGFVTFLTGVLSNGTSRFLIFSLGKGDYEELKATFTTCFWLHVLIGLGLAILLEPIGLWFLHNKLIIPADRLYAATCVFHISIITLIISMIQIPFTATIIAHEKMDVYAYTGLIDVFFKLGVVFLLKVILLDKLIVYAILLLMVAIGMTLFFLFYCRKSFSECVLKFRIEKNILSPLAKYSGWQLFANIATALSNQGILVLLNMFFSPAVVAARSISLQVDGFANQFMTNFRTAVNPQIIKKYAQEDFEGSKKLLLESTKYSYYLMLLIALPVVLLSTQLLQAWLGQVPQYADVFLQLVMIQELFQVFNSSFYTAINAKGQMKENALSAPAILFAAFPVVYVLFKLGFSPISLSFAYIISYALLAIIQKPIILIKVVGYKWSDFKDVFVRCTVVTVLSAAFPIYLRFFLIDKITDNGVIAFLTIAFVSVFCVLITTWFLGINKSTRVQVVELVKSKINYDRNKR